MMMKMSLMIKLLLLLLYRYVLLVASVAIAATAATSVTAAMVRDDATTHYDDDDDSTNDNAIPTWEELDARPLPTWYDDAKFGIFIHWGVFSVPSFNGEWMWHNWNTNHDQETIDFLKRTERYPHFTYPEYAARFQAELYQPQEWAQVFAQSGAQYVVLTSKHHDGYCNWNSKNITTTWNWNVMDIGPNRDVLGDLAQEVKQVVSPHTNVPLKFGIYHSLYEWYNPMYLSDQVNNFTTHQFVTTKTIPELYDLVRQYEPELIWSDGDWEAHSDYWQAREFLYWYTNQSTVASTAVYNDRWGSDVLCHHGSFLTCSDKYNPNQLQKRKYENAFTIDVSSWGYNRNTHNNVSLYYLTTQEIIHTIVQVVAFNGNVLLNIGPNADGTIDPIFLDRLHNIGNWLSVNGEAIYSTRPWTICQNETSSSVFYTTRKFQDKGSNSETRLYAIFTKWPTNNMLPLQCVVPTSATKISFVGIQYHDLSAENANGLEYRPIVRQSTALDDDDDEVTTLKRRRMSEERNSGIEIVLPALTPDKIPCQHAWVIALTHIENV